MNRADLPQPNKTCEVCGRKYRRCKKCVELRNRGVEAWREHCDSIECYQTLILANSDPSKVTLEEYERVIALELPEGNKPVKEIQDKLDAIKSAIDEKSKPKQVEQPKNVYQSGKKEEFGKKNFIPYKGQQKK